MSARFRTRAPGPVSGQLCHAPGRRTGHHGAGFLLPFGRRPSLLGHPVPPAGFRPSYDRPTAPPADGADPSGFSMFRTRETRLAQGALCTPGAAVSTRPVVLPAAACRISAASPCRPGLQPAPGRIVDEASARVHCHSPHTSLPLACDPGRNGVLGLSLSFAPGRAGPGNARQGGDRPGHCLDYVPGISQPPSTYSLTTCDLTSQELADLCSKPISGPATARRTDSALGSLTFRNVDRAT
jgi:hypothetical protein